MMEFQELYNFVDRAKRNRKYPETTAQSLRAALKLYDAELSQEEKASLAKVRENFEQINRNVFSKNAAKFTASSLAAYKSRVLKVLADFERYGDPVKMNSWSPKVIQRTLKTKTHSTPGTEADGSEHEEFGQSLTQPNIFSDKGSGWSLVIRSKALVSSEIKKKIVDVSDLLSDLNKVSDTV